MEGEVNEVEVNEVSRPYFGAKFKTTSTGFQRKAEKKKPATTRPITSSIFHLNKFEFTGSKFEFVQIEKII